MLRRAVSSAYYAMFHCLAQDCADLFIGGAGADRSKPAWRQVYRALEHGAARSQCQNSAVISRFPKPVEDFAVAFVAMLLKRHRADYAPDGVFLKSDVSSDVEIVRKAITSYRKVAIPDRRAFCAWILLHRSRANP